MSEEYRQFDDRTKLVTIIAPYETAERVKAALRSVGATACTVSAVEGYGLHGSRTSGLLDAANVRVEALVPAPIARAILDLVNRDFAEEAVLAYVLDVETANRR